MITLCSIFRNSGRYLRRYWDQIDGLRELTDVRVVGTWGDSDDNTYDLLKNRDMELHEYHHGGPNFGSVDHGPRWDQIAKVVRHTLDQVGNPGLALVWVESDLIWEPSELYALVADICINKCQAVAPMVMANGEDRFYDVWGFRQNGQMFSGGAPYFQDVRQPETGLVKIDSCGSCFVTREDHWREWTGHWPYTAGGNLWLDPHFKIRHP